MKYKVGDKFLAEIKVGKIDENSITPYKMLPYGDWNGEAILNRMRRPDDMTAKETWEIAVKLIKMTIPDRTRIFGNCEACGVVNDYSFPEIKVKIEAWEAKEKEIKVGDVVCLVTNPEIKAIITVRHETGYYDAIGSGGLVPVSYTHLDVYKRQR